jgi:two-component system nitrogen regulation response regulator GlnG
MKPIWIVDDDESIRWVLEKALARENLATRSFSNARDAMDALQTTTPQVLVSDIRMPGESGLALLQAAKARYPGLPVIIMTAFSDLDSAVAAFQGGAFEYLAKPFDLEKAVELIRRALEESLREVNEEQIISDTPEILGQAPAMQDVFRAIGRLSQSNVTVLITGESGSGKELVARALHKHSPRASQPFIALNTAAIPKDLLESELFGHERGAFTGAQATRRGRFEQAEGGTFFLDEIGDMPFDMQVNLLRFLQEKTIERVGGNEPLPIDVRVIAATHINLAEAVREGRFREDLFYRINVVCIEIPPLADRGVDIEQIAKYYFARFASTQNRSLRGFSKAAMNAMLSHSWPGNVRELVNRVHRATVMAEGRFIQPEDLGFERTTGQTQIMSLEDARAAAESRVIQRALSQSRNQISRAAALLGISRVTLYRLIEKYNIRSATRGGNDPAPADKEAASGDGAARKLPR